MRREALARALPVACAAQLAAACEIQQVVVAEAEPFVVAEAFLVTGAPLRVALHASAGGAELIEPDATVRVTGPDSSIVFTRADPGQCLAFGYGVDEQQFPGGFACYVDGGAVLRDSLIEFIEPGEAYRLHIELANGRTLDGATRVPAQTTFADDAELCYLEPWTHAELTWSSAAGAAAYILDLEAIGVQEALAREGIEADVPEPLVLRGLAVGERDTTVVLPAEFGLFDRFSLDPELTLALQRGIPEGIYTEIVVAAVDENFVDWVRGGDFNPSGLVRTPSLFGDAGTGVIGSATTDRLNVSTYDEDADVNPCGASPTS